MPSDLKPTVRIKTNQAKKAVKPSKKLSDKSALN